MKEGLSHLSIPREEASLGRGDFRGDETMGVIPVALQEVSHELRQPLGVIESLAYYLELTSTDERTRGHLQRIQAMVLQAHRILEHACACPQDFVLEPAAC